MYVSRFVLICSSFFVFAGPGPALQRDQVRGGDVGDLAAEPLHALLRRAFPRLQGPQDRHHALPHAGARGCVRGPNRLAVLLLGWVAGCGRRTFFLFLWTFCGYIPGGRVVVRIYHEITRTKGSAFLSSPCWRLLDDDDDDDDDGDGLSPLRPNIHVFCTMSYYIDDRTTRK